MRAILGACLIAAFVAVPATAQQQVQQVALPALCGPEEVIQSALRQLNERVTHIAETSTNGTVTIWQREDGNAWTFVFHPVEGVACIVADGINFTAL